MYPCLSLFPSILPSYSLSSSVLFACLSSFPPYSRFPHFLISLFVFSLFLFLSFPASLWPSLSLCFCLSVFVPLSLLFCLFLLCFNILIQCIFLYHWVCLCPSECLCICMLLALFDNPRVKVGATQQIPLLPPDTICISLSSYLARRIAGSLRSRSNNRHRLNHAEPKTETRTYTERDSYRDIHRDSGRNSEFMSKRKRQRKHE